MNLYTADTAVRRHRNQLRTRVARAESRHEPLTPPQLAVIRRALTLDGHRLILEKPRLLARCAECGKHVHHGVHIGKKITLCRSCIETAAELLEVQTKR